MLVYLCDDSQSDLMRLQHYLKTYSNDVLVDFRVKCFTSGSAMLNSYVREPDKPDIIFLDIYMSGADGISVAKELIKTGCQNGIVFTTSSDEHAIEAFRLNADGYLHKPYTQEDFAASMKRFSNLFSQQQKFITLNFNRNEFRINLKNLIYLDTKNHCTHFHTVSGSSKTARPIKEYISFFEQYSNFLVCGKSFIVNMDFIADFDGEIITLRDGTLVPVPVRVRHTVSEAIRYYREKTAQL